MNKIHQGETSNTDKNIIKNDKTEVTYGKKDY